MAMGTKLKILSFNIRCFGYNGEYFAKSKFESRIDFLRDFISQNYSDIDVFIFQEIMDQSLLQQILPKGFRSYSYNHLYPRHMFVTLACKEGLEFKDVKVIEDTTLDAEKSRPALTGTLYSKEKILGQFIGVHLKSGYEHTDKRIYQCNSITKFIKTLPNELPVILGGDFNSHDSIKTRNLFDDLEIFRGVFKDQLESIPHNAQTYLSSKEKISLDHFWIRNCKAESILVFDYKLYSSPMGAQKFYREISDHSPVQLEILI